MKGSTPQVKNKIITEFKFRQIRVIDSHQNQDFATPKYLNQNRLLFYYFRNDHQPIREALNKTHNILRVTKQAAVRAAAVNDDRKNFEKILKK
jgi:hypothetical protein